MTNNRSGNQEKPSSKTALIDFQTRKTLKPFLKFTAMGVLFFFTSSQIGWSAAEYQASNTGAYVAVKDADEAVEKAAEAPSADETLRTTQDFLQDSLSLTSAADEEKKEEQAVSSKTVKPETPVYERERQSFEDAVQLMRQEFAAAVILKDIKAEDLKKLAALDFETAVIVLDGEIVLFSTGSADEIGVLPAAHELLEKAAFISHVHPGVSAHQGPSDLDIEHASGRDEYVITAEGVYGFNREGALNGGRAYSFDWYLQRLKGEVAAADRDQVEARASLNEFIRQMDLYNESADREVFRASGDITIEAEGMQSKNGWTSFQPGYAFMWGGDEISAVRTTDPGIYQIEVVAFGVSGNGALPMMQVKSGKAQVADAVTVQNNGWNFHSYFFNDVEFEAGSQKVAVSFINDSGPRDLYIDKIILHKVADLPATPRITLEAESIQVQGSTWTDTQNGYVSLWGNGEVYQNQNFTETGLYDIEVFASGQMGENILPQMTLKTDTLQIGDPVEVTNNNWSYKSFVYKNVDIEAGVHRIAAAYINDGGSNNRGMSIDKIVIKKVGERPALPRVNVEAESMQSRNGWTWNGGSYVLVWGGDELSSIQNLAESGLYEVEVRAFGVEGNGALPMMQVAADSRQLGDVVTVSNNQWNYKSYTFKDLKLEAGQHKFSVAFINDSGPRDLYVDKIIVRKIGELPALPRVTIEAESMQASQNHTWMGNGSALLWSNDEISSLQDLVQSGVYEIEVVALGQEDGALKPEMQVKVDGREVAKPVKVSNNNWAYKSYVFENIEIESGLRKISAGFTNDQGNLDLYIDKIILRKTGELPAGPRVKLEAESMQHTTGGVTSNGDGWIIWANGQVFDSAAVSAADTYEIEVVAHGKAALGVAPLMNVLVDGVAKGTDISVQNHNWSYGSYFVRNVSLSAGTHQFAVQYTNDYNGGTWDTDRNLVVDKIIVRKMQSPWQGPVNAQINGSLAYSASTDVPLTILKNYGDLTGWQMSYSWDSETNYSAWEAAASSRTLQFPGAQGMHTIRVKVKDPAGQVYSFQNTLTFDSQLPFGRSLLNNGAAYSTSRSVVINSDVRDLISGISQMSFSFDKGQTWSAWENYAFSKQISFPEDGEKWMAARFRDAAGNTITLWDSIVVDSVLPAGSIEINSGQPETNSRNVTVALTAGDTNLDKMRFSMDGGQTWTAWEATASSKSLTLPDGNGSKEIRYQLSDKAGNISTYWDSIVYYTNSGVQETLLQDNTRLISRNGVVFKEITPAGSSVFYAPDGSTTDYLYADGQRLEYPQTSTGQTRLIGANGQLIESISKPAVSVLDESAAVKTSLEGGVDAFYVDGQLKELRTVSGVRVTDFVLDAEFNILSALMSYPDGTLGVVRKGALIRKINPDGSIQDYTPQGFLVREIATSAVQYAAFTKVSQTQISATRFFTKDGISSRYDELGILREVTGLNGQHFVYDRAQVQNGYTTALNTAASSAAPAQGLVQAAYTTAGALSKMTLQDGTQIFVESGRVTRVLDHENHEITYSYSQAQELLSGLQVTRGSSTFRYDNTGFLSEITTQDGTIRRIQSDTNGDGQITDQDAIKLLLETVGGDTLSDFELDSQGHILNGIIETKEGVRQTIQNGILTGFETVDGKIYEMQNITGGRQAVLKEWKMRDGTRVVYGGGTVSEVVFPDGKRLHTIGFDANKEIETVTEELPDGTKKFFQKGRLVKLITPNESEIYYDFTGMAEKVVLPDDSQETISYQRDAAGEVTEIIFTGEHSRRVFSPDGGLLRLLTDGVSAVVEGNEISSLSTLFGEIESPVFSSTGILSGTLHFVDGINQEISNGNLTKVTAQDGTIVEYTAGKISAVVAGGKRYEIIYGNGANGTLESASVRLTFKPGSPEYPLVPYLLNSRELIDGSAFYDRDRAVFNGNAHVDTSDLKVGTGSVALDGSGDFLQFEEGNGSDFQFGSSDFTVDFWFKPAVIESGSQFLWSQYTGGSTNNNMSISVANGKLTAYLEKGGQPWGGLLQGTPTVQAGVWQHAALVRTGNTVRLFLNGQQVASAGVSGDAPGGNFYTTAGARMSGSGYVYFFNGRMDEVRISKGMSRWSSNFEPPVTSAQYAPAAGVRTLHFNPVSEIPAADQKLSQILMAKPLHNAIQDPLKVQSEFNTGDTLFFSKIVADDQRGNTTEFQNPFSPEWANISQSLAQGYEGITNNLNLSASLVDLNGDGLPDRVYSEGSSSNYWWVQFNTGSGFSNAVQWNGVETSTSYGLLRQTDGNQPMITSDLIDINGDHKPDRILEKMGSAQEWYVQINNGAGFDAPVLWQGALQILPSSNTTLNYALQVRNDLSLDLQETVVDLVDLDGDGLVDRVLRPSTPPYTRWFFQKNTGNGFADAVLWEGVDTSFAPDATRGSALSWSDAWINGRYTTASFYYDPYMTELVNMWVPYNVSCYGTGDPGCLANASALGSRAYMGMPATQSTLIDMNGDGLKDRVILKAKNINDENRSARDWYVQFNNGEGFDAPVLWDDEVRNVPNIYATIRGQDHPTSSQFYPPWSDGDYGVGYNNGKFGTSIRVVDGWESPSSILTDLRDVTGDGLPDRITVDAFTHTYAATSVWWVEVNNGHGFDTAVAWSGIFGNDELETAIGQDTEASKKWPVGSINLKIRNMFEDINGDKIPDRLIYRAGESKWYVQFGTGHGFMPVQNLEIDALKTSTSQISTSRYDYLHVSLKAAANIPQATGVVKVSLGDPAVPASYQEWTVSNLTASWKDIYLPIDKTRGNAGQVKITFIPAGTDPHIAIDVDNLTFTSVRPPATKDWLDRLLTEEDILAEVHSDRNQTLAQYLGLSEATAAADFDWNQLLKSEMKIDFDQSGEAVKFQTLYGSVSKVQNGRVTETTMPDGSKVQFSEENASSPQTFTQTLTKADGTVETMQLSYGRVRTVSRPGKSPLEYSYEFDAQGREVTAVRDPDTGITERYRENVLISRTQANGVVTSFTYDAEGKLASSTISYKGRVHQTFMYETGETGSRLVRNSDGVLEEYGQDGKIVAHTTPDGYRYVHTTERAKKAVTTMEIENVTLPDNTVFSVQVPVVTLVDDPQGEEVHRVTFAGFRAATGEEVGFDGGTLKTVALQDGTKISFDRFEVVEHLDEETGEMTREIHLLDASVIHPDGTVTEFKAGKPFSVTSAAGHVISLETDKGYLINPNESAAFHQTRAQKLWNETVLAKWTGFQPPRTLQVQIEYEMDGEVLTREFAEGVIEVYEDNRIQYTLDPSGEKLIQYEYDTEGNPTRIELGAARRRLQASVLKLKAEIAIERQRALAQIAEREQVINQTVEAQYLIVRDQLLAIRAQIQAEADRVSSMKVKGKKAKNAISDAMQAIQGGFSQVDSALEQLARNRADALKQLSEQVRQVSEQIETQSAQAYAQIETENAKSRRSILRQEISPVVYHWYRKILGRDPSQAEYDTIINSANYEAGTFDLAGLKTSLLQSTELVQRTAQVNAIKGQVQTQLLAYLGMNQTARAAVIQSLGIAPDEAVDLSASEADEVLDWIMQGSLHFGQSAYLALEALLSDAGISFDRVQLATRLIMTDILSGVITPLEEGDLVISVYALKRAAAHYGLNTDGYRVSYDVLKSTYDDACAGQPVPCAFRLVAHINGNHFIIITKVTATEVTYIDPGAGPENATDQRVVSKDAFLATWVSSLNLDGSNSNASGNAAGSSQTGFGYIFTARAPPASAPAAQVKKLDVQEQMSVRGAFFPFIVFIAVAIANAVVAAVSAAIAAISAIISGLIAGIGSFISGIGSFFGSLFTGNIFGALQGLFGGILQGIGQIAGGLLNGILNFGTTFLQTFGALQAGAVTPLQALTGATGLFGTGVVGSAVVNSTILVGAFGLGLQAIGTLLDFAGVSPKISQSIVAGGKIIAGVALLATANPIGVAGAIGLVASGTSEMLALHTSLSPTVTHVIGIGASALAAFAGGVFNPNLSGLATLKLAAPHLVMDLASSGVVAAGNALGLDPRISGLIALPVSVALGNLTTGLLNPNGGGGPGLLGVIKAALGGAVVAGADLALSAINAPDVVKGLGGLLVSSIVEGLIPHQAIEVDSEGRLILTTQKKGILNSVLDAFGNAAVTTLGAVVFNPVTFVESVQTNGLKKTLDLFLGYGLKRQTLESFYSSTVSIGDLVIDKLNNNFQLIQYRPGVMAKVVTLENNGKKMILTFSATDGRLLELRENGRVLEGEDIRIGVQGIPTVLEGTETVLEADGAVRFTQYEDGKVSMIQYRGDGANLDYFSTEDSPLRVSADGLVLDGAIENLDSGSRFYLKDGKVTKSEQLLKAYGAGDTTTENTQIYIVTRYNINGTVLDSKLAIRDSNGELVNLDKLRTQSVQNGANQAIIAYLDENGVPLLATDGKGIVVGANAVDLLKNAEVRFRQTPFGILVPEEGELNSGNFDSNLDSQFANKPGVFESTKQQIDNFTGLSGSRPLRQVVFESSVTSPKATNSSVSLSSKQQHVLLYNGAGAAHEYVQAEFNGGASLVTVGKAPLAGLNNPNLYGVSNTKLSLSGQGTTLRAGIGGQYTEIFQSQDPSLNNKQAKISFGLFTEISEGKASMVLQSQVSIDGQLYNIETKMSPKKGITGSNSVKTLDSFKNDLLDDTINTMNAIHAGQTLSADAVISSSVVMDLMRSSMEGLPSGILNSVNASLEQFLADIASSANVDDVSLDKRAGL